MYKHLSMYQQSYAHHPAHARDDTKSVQNVARTPIEPNDQRIRHGLLRRFEHPKHGIPRAFHAADGIDVVGGQPSRVHGTIERGICRFHPVEIVHHEVSFGHIEYRRMVVRLRHDFLILMIY